MFKLKLNQKRIGIFLLVLSILLSMMNSVFANESYSYTYVGVAENGEKDGTASTAIMNVKDNDGKIYKVYCIDKDIYTKDEQKYSLNNLEDMSNYTRENMNKIRNIVISSYPYISIEKLRTLSGIPNLTTAQAIAGTQAAIWHYSNNLNKTSLKGNAYKLYDWYLKLPETTLEEAKVANVEIQQETNVVNDKMEVKILYKVDKNNSDGSKINLDYSFDKDLKNIYGAEIEDLQVDSQGYSGIKISNLERNAKFTINITGTQKLRTNAYFYLPQGGEKVAQSLVGVRDDTTPILATKTVDLSIAGYTLTINKIDAIDLSGIGGAEFKIASDSEFTKNVREIKTQANGKADVTGLTKGTWYLKETKAPTGYIPNSEVIPVYINEANIQLDIKNSKLGRIEILKVDENKNPVKGSKFTLYKDAVEDKNILNANLESDENGKIEIESLLPGKYLLVETYTPDDYLLDNKIIELDVDAYKTTQVTHLNETKGYATIKIYKKDAVSKEQLSDCEVGIYSDSGYKNLIKTITTKADGAIILNDLRPGIYYLKELKAPKGYLLDSAPKQITLNKNDVIEVTFYNSKNYSTAGNYATTMFVGMIICLVGATTIIVKKIIKNRRKNVQENS